MKEWNEPKLEELNVKMTAGKGYGFGHHTEECAYRLSHGKLECTCSVVPRS